VFECARRAGVLRLARPGTRWLSSGWAGGFSVADTAYNVTVQEGFARTDLSAYAAERRAEAGFPETGPTLLTGVEQRHARGARLGPVEAVATAGVSNPAVLPMAPGDGTLREATDGGTHGTVNVFVGTTRALDDGGLATLLGVAVEAKTATLLHATGFPGTTSDAVVVGCGPAGEAAAFAGSATPVGAAARACVREAVRAALAARYADAAPPESLTAAKYGVSTDVEAVTFRPGY
jgi:adenosylcobinamide hydrolase